MYAYSQTLLILQHLITSSEFKQGIFSGNALVVSFNPVPGTASNLPDPGRDQQIEVKITLREGQLYGLRQKLEEARQAEHAARRREAQGEDLREFLNSGTSLTFSCISQGRYSTVVIIARLEYSGCWDGRRRRTGFDVLEDTFGNSSMHSLGLNCYCRQGRRAAGITSSLERVAESFNPVPWRPNGWRAGVEWRTLFANQWLIRS